MTGRGANDGSALEPPTFDPRHDARFQRGYQHGDAPRPPARAPLIGAPPAPARPAEPSWPDLLDGVRPGGDPGGDPTDSDLSDTDPLDTDPFDADAFQDEFASPKKNPFIVSLWTASILFVVAALTLQWQAATNAFANYSYSGNGPVPFGMLLQQLSYSITPPILIASLVTMAGLLFWHAWTWQARRGTITRPD